MKALICLEVIAVLIMGAVLSTSYSAFLEQQDKAARVEANATYSETFNY